MYNILGKKTKISIHALVKRATLASRRSFQLVIYFNPRPREEGDRMRYSIPFGLPIFQSTPS